MFTSMAEQYWVVGRKRNDIVEWTTSAMARPTTRIEWTHDRALAHKFDDEFSAAGACKNIVECSFGRQNETTEEELFIDPPINWNL
jgi:hypothetical protein